MKTAERILVTSLDLFNQFGEANVSSVDIAVELDISPGNLYYHFKGKEVIVAALFDMYKRKMDHIQNATLSQSLSIEDFFYVLYLLLEQGHLFQFLHHNPIDLVSKYPSIAKTFKTQLILQEKCFEKLLRQFVNDGVINAQQGQITQMIELIGLVFTQSANYYALKGQTLSDDDHLYKGLATILFAILPYITIEQSELHNLQEAILTHSLASEMVSAI